MKYKQFIFKDYRFDAETKVLELHYGMDDALEFTETFTFDFELAQYDPHALDRALQNLFFMAGISYYKMYIPPEIVVHQGKLDQASADFFSKTYQRGLGEFWYVNKLNPRTSVIFPVNTTESQLFTSDGKGLLASVGGGKDSLLTIELLRRYHPYTTTHPTPEKPQPAAKSGTLTSFDHSISNLQVPKTPSEKAADQQAREKARRAESGFLTTWSVNHRPQLTPLVERIGLPHYWVERAWDPQLQTLNQQDALNGHIPISAIFACVGTIVAILAGKRDVVMSNEQSANEPTLTYEGVPINHQYSKSQEFEEDYQALLKRQFGDSIRYYSLLRPYSELHIAELFARLAFDKYKDVFSSCNRAYVHTSDHMSWCGICPKCAFTFLVLTPFIPRKKLEALWGGKNLLLDPGLEPLYEQLLGIAGDKPLDCVGEVKESRAAMTLAQQQYPQLLKYHFDLPADYDYRKLWPASMPEELLRLVILQV
ncbi:MAG TPA: hypothetical protein VK674_01915 [Candidatus Limnocylindria bacterium]|nr:hypothetical protein [Candidatus Limnocylindria bacterium]